VDYWNHNAAYHPMIVSTAAGLGGDVLDVGCGEGLLVERLATVSRTVTGVDRDGRALGRAAVRTAGLANTSLVEVDFLEFASAPGSYDLITMVAVLHHLDLTAGLCRSAALLRPGGQLLVVGLSANKSMGDYVRSAVLLPLVRGLSVLHHGNRAVQVVAVPPTESFAEIREMARHLLPGVRLRRALYYRYILAWTKPASSESNLPVTG